MSESLDYKFAQATRNLVLGDDGLREQFQVLDWYAAGLLGEEFAGVQACLLDQGIVYKVIEVRKAAPIGLINTLVARPYEALTPEDPALVAIGGLQLRYTDVFRTPVTIREEIYERSTDGVIGLVGAEQSAYDASDAIQLSRLVDQLRTAACRLHLRLKSDSSAIEDGNIWD